MPSLLKNIFLVVLLLPLFCLPFIPFGFETPKVLLFEVITLGLFFYLLLLHNSIISRQLSIGIVGLVFLSITTLLFHYSETVWFNNPIRLQGLFMQLVLTLWLIVAFMQKERRMHKTISLICFILVTLSGLFIQDPVSYRAVGTLGEANSYAGMSVLLGILTVFSWKEKRHFAVVIVIVFLFSCLAVLLSASRSGLLTLLMSTILFVLWEKKFHEIKIVSVGILLLLSSLVLPFFSRTNSWEDRSMIWQTAVFAGYQSPLIGHGFGNITAALKEASEPLQNHIRFQFVDSSHNIFLDWWVQGGIIGIGLLVYFVVFSIDSFIKKKMVLELLLLFACLQLLVFNPMSIAILAIFWWCIGRGFSTHIPS